MAVNPIPTIYNRVMPYLGISRGLEFIDFAKTVFGAIEMRRMGPPGGPIMHAELKIADSTIMFSEERDSQEQPVLMIYVSNCDEIFEKALAAGATSRGAPVDQFYGDRIAKIVDPAGVHWAICSRFADLTDEEIRQRARGKH